ncbi:MAG: LysR family transcriptional regulator [Clostridia bacterium]|nr:LysR family transcriptional regulator [Clostridia bacterium]
MLFRQMKYFTTVVECNSFTEAAERCFISQSAISQQIRALEKDLGVELIRRENRRFTLTPAGEYFYSQSRLMLEEADAIRRETIRLAQSDNTKLRLGYPKNYSGREFHEAIAEFTGVHPEISIDIVNGTHEELYDMIRFGRVDLVINDQRRVFSDEYENYVLSDGCCFIEISSNNPLSAQKKITFAELKRLSCILIAPPKQREAEQSYYRDTLGFSGNFLFAENLEEGRLMVLGNRGFLPLECFGSLAPVVSAIRRIPLYRGDQPIRRKICAFWRKQQPNCRAKDFTLTLHALIQRSCCK